MENNQENNGLLFVGKDENLSSVYIVSKEFVQKDTVFWVKVRFELLLLSQYFQNILVFLKDHDSENENLTYIEEMWAFQPSKNRYGILDRSYKCSDGKLLYESTFESPKWISLDSVPQKGIVKQVYEIAQDKFFRPVNLFPGLNIKTTNSEESEVIEIESLNFRAKATKKVKKNETGVHVIVDQIDPVNKKVIKFAYIFLKNGNLREDLDWEEGKDYDRVAWVDFLNEGEADSYIEELKQYLIKLEEWIKGDSINGKESSKSNTSEDFSHAVMNTFSYLAQIPFGVWVLLTCLILGGILVYNNQRQEKIAEEKKVEEKAKQAAEKEEQRKRDYEECKYRAIFYYKVDWEGECKRLERGPNCALSRVIANDLEMRLTEARGLCLKEYQHIR